MTLFIGICLSATMVQAHAQYRPFSVNRYTVISFDGQEVRISYSITVGDLPAQKLRKRADQDRDGVLSAGEKEPLKKWMRNLVFSGLYTQLDGKPIRPVLGTEVVDLVSDRIKMFAPMRFTYQLSLPCQPGRHELTYHDRIRLPTLEQTELFVRKTPGMSLDGIYQLDARRKSERRIYWERGELPGPLSIRFVLRESSDPADPDRPSQAKMVDDSGPLKRALANRQLGLFGMLAALGLALLLGSVHALSPGHGKALVATYLVGSRGKMRHAVILGLIVTFTHIFSVVILGLVALWATEKVLPERLAPWLTLVAGLTVLALGVWMLWSRLRKRSHVHPHDHVHPREIRWGELLILGISGGMVPCVSATVVLLFAVYLGRIVFGLLMIAAFSLGLALTLMILGILVVRGRKLFERWTSGRGKKLVGLLPAASAAAVAVLGAVMVAMAIDGL